MVPGFRPDVRVSTLDNNDFDAGDKDMKTSTLSFLFSYRFGFEY